MDRYFNYASQRLLKTGEKSIGNIIILVYFKKILFITKKKVIGIKEYNCMYNKIFRKYYFLDEYHVLSGVQR